MKCLYIFIFAQFSLLGHGFSGNTLVWCVNKTWQQIDILAHRVQKKNIFIPSLDEKLFQQTTAQILHSGHSKSYCLIRFGFEEIYHHIGAATGGTVGSFFGPPTFLIGVLLGCALSITFKQVYENVIPAYTINDQNPAIFEHCMQQNSTSFESSYTSEYNQQNAFALHMNTSNGNIHEEQQKQVSYSIVVQPLVKETRGCGNAKSQGATTHVYVPAASINEMPARPIPEPEKAPICITPVTNLPLPQIFNLEDSTQSQKPSIPLFVPSNKEISDNKRKEVLKGSDQDKSSSTGTKIYRSPKGYNEALQDFEKISLSKVKNIQNGEVWIGFLPDERRVILRKVSKGSYDGKKNGLHLKYKINMGIKN